MGAVFRGHTGSGGLSDTEGIGHIALTAQESGGNEHHVHIHGIGVQFGHLAACPAEVHGGDTGEIALIVPQKFLHGGVVDAGVLALEMDGLLLTVIGFQDVGPLGPGIGGQPLNGRLAIISNWITCLQP